MFLQAEEVTEARRLATAKLSITVKPVDVNPPVINATAEEGTVLENAPVGTKVLDKEGLPIKLTVSDPDLVNILIEKNFKNELYSSYSF